MYVDLKIVAAVLLTATLTLALTSPQKAVADGPPESAVCLKIAFMSTKPAMRVQEFMREQQQSGYERFVSLPMGDGAGLMCTW